MERKNWTREELILAINLYCQLPFGRLHRGNPEVIKLANLINRTPSAVAYKLVNFASFDLSLKARGIKGASNASKLDKEIWDEFFNNIATLSYESEKLLAKYNHTTLDKIIEIDENILIKEGKTKEAIIQVRVNQAFFRNTILAAYNNTCCITGIQQPDLLIAGHIKPWGIDEKNRLNPQNGIAINALHDKAFENGLMTILPNYKIQISSILKKQNKNEAIIDYFLKYDGREIILPSKFLPNTEFLEYHNEERFKK